MKPFTGVRHLRLLKPEWEPTAGRYYCCVCIDQHDSGDGWWSEQSVMGHLSAYHDIEKHEADSGVHYCTSSHLKVKLRRWREENDREASRFGLSAASLLGLDDFLFEAGDS